jgi:hypothetical protein
VCRGETNETVPSPGRRAHMHESRSGQRKSPGSNRARPRRHILVCVRRNTAGANKFGTVRTGRRMRERKPSRNCPLRGQWSNGSKRIVRRGLLVPDAAEPALFSRGSMKIRLTTPSWQEITHGNGDRENSFNSRDPSRSVGSQNAVVNIHLHSQAARWPENFAKNHCVA